MLVLLSGPLHAAVPAPASDRKQRNVNGEKSHPAGAPRVGGAACSAMRVGWVAHCG